MNNEIRERYLKLALVVSGIAFLLVYPLGIVWPTGWVWHGGQGSYYSQMISGVYVVLGIFLIAAARNPAENRSLISFTIWSRGLGWVQRWGGPVEEIRPGDVVWISPGEKHWHGATPTTAMTHIAVQEALNGNPVEWMEQVSDEQYQAL